MTAPMTMLSTLLGLDEGEHPFPWQERLLAEHFLKGQIPEALDIPTGLGKTSVIAIWTSPGRALEQDPIHNQTRNPEL